MGREIELKFHCEPQDLPAVLAAAPAGDEEVRELISVYFDTPDRALARAGVSLRVRESGGQRIQTLKRGQGLAREEHEQPVPGFKPDPKAPPLSEILPPDAAEALSPAFYVGVHRRQRLVRRGHAEIEIALDHGEVRAGEGKSPISEVELELKSGPVDALFDLARELVDAAPLYLSFQSKSQMGQALRDGRPRGRLRPALRPEATAAQAFQTVARQALGEIARNGGLLRAAPSAEGVHQLRVATRRLRSALSTFAPLVRDERMETLKGELRWLAGACNDARDWDVLAAGTALAAAALEPRPPGLERLMRAIEARQAQSAGPPAEAIASARFRKLLVELTAWIETGPWLADAARAELRATPARLFAADRLERQLKRVRRRAKAFAQADEAARHDLRIEGKKLRYATQSFASLYGEKAVARIGEPLKALQEELGAVNDAAVARRLIGQLPLDVETAFAAGEVCGVRAAETRERLRRAHRALHRLLEARPFWR
jgi:triphosphatase